MAIMRWLRAYFGRRRVSPFFDQKGFLARNGIRTRVTPGPVGFTGSEISEGYCHCGVLSLRPRPFEWGDFYNPDGTPRRGLVTRFHRRPRFVLRVKP